MSETLKKFLMHEWITWRLVYAVSIFAMFFCIFIGPKSDDAILIVIAMLARILHNQEEQ